jgi:flagellar motility protein MotE (MotC chaperone)
MGIKSRSAARVLPAIVLLLIAILPIRVGLVWQTAEQMANAEEVKAQAAARETEVAPEPAPLSDTAAAASQSEPTEQAAAEPAPVFADEPFDPQTMTKADYELLQQLAKRRAELEQREQDLADRAAMLEAVQQQISTKVGEQQKLKADIEKLAGSGQDAGSIKYRRLVKIYESMKPEEAARILEKMDGEVLLEVVTRMGERRLAPILAQMDPLKAQAITVAMAMQPDPTEEIAEAPGAAAAPAAQPAAQ